MHQGNQIWPNLVRDLNWNIKATKFASEKTHKKTLVFHLTIQWNFGNHKFIPINENWLKTAWTKILQFYSHIASIWNVHSKNTVFILQFKFHKTCLGITWLIVSKRRNTIIWTIHPSSASNNLIKWHFPFSCKIQCTPDITRFIFIQATRKINTIARP